MKYKDIQLIVFDVDQTLTESKSDLSPEMADALCDLLTYKKVAFISGGTFNQLSTQVVAHMPCDNKWANLYILPTSGAQLFEYRETWTPVYEETLTPEERTRITDEITAALKEVGIDTPEKIFGERIEDRVTQITFSGLGQEAPLELKEKWDPDGLKRKMLQKNLQEKLPEFDVSLGGSTSIDITKKGRDKAYGVERLLDHLSLSTENVLFIGDAIVPGGNDYSIVSLDIDYINVEDIRETEAHIKDIIDNSGVSH